MVSISRHCIVAILISFASSTAALRSPTVLKLNRKMHQTSSPPRSLAVAESQLAAAALTAVMLASQPLPARALTPFLDTASALTIAVVPICDSAGRCTRPAGAPTAQPPSLSSAEYLKKEAAKASSSLERASKEANYQATKATRDATKLLPKDAQKAAAKASRDVESTVQRASKEANYQATKATRDATKLLPKDAQKAAAKASRDVESTVGRASKEANYQATKASRDMEKTVNRASKEADYQATKASKTAQKAATQLQKDLGRNLGF